MAGRKICISVDSSQTSQEAVTWAAGHFIRPGDEVRVVTVVEPAVKGELFWGAGQRAPIVDKECAVDPATMARAEKLLADCKQQLAAQGADPSKIATAPLLACIGSSNDIGRHILEFTEEQKCDCLVVGSRGMGMSKRAMLGMLGLGSISSYLVKNAGCNVVVHKPGAAA